MPKQDNAAHAPHTISACLNKTLTYYFSIMSFTINNLFTNFRFADIFGLDLSEVKTFVDEIPKVPRSAFKVKFFLYCLLILKIFRISMLFSTLSGINIKIHNLF